MATGREHIRADAIADDGGDDRELRGRYSDRLIVFDVPPILSGADTLALSTYMDATILLVEEGKTPRDDIERSCELLRHSNLMGVVLNKSRELPEPDPITRPKPGFFQRIFGAEGLATMYEGFYGFKVKPFSLLPQEEFMFLSRQHRMALDLLIYGLRNQAMFCVVCGDIGTGKTTLMRYLLSRHGPRMSVGMITGVNGTFTELMQWMLAEFGLEYRGLDKISMQHALIQFSRTRRRAAGA